LQKTIKLGGDEEKAFCDNDAEPLICAVDECTESPSPCESNAGTNKSVTSVQ